MERFDVIIVGAGVAGSLIAYRLGLARKKVLVLESGPEIDRKEALATFATADTKTPGSPYRKQANAHTRPDEAPDDPGRSYYQQVPGAPFKSTYQRAIGGSTWHWLGNVPRLIPSDFKMESLFGKGTDWPITYSDLEPWYAQAEAELGVAGNSSQWDGLLGAHRSSPFPMSEIWPSYSDLVVEGVLQNTTFDGISLSPNRTPQARNARPYDGRPACAGNSTCVPLCPIQAKYDATVHVKKARINGVEIRPSCTVTRLIKSNETSRIINVEYARSDGTLTSAEAEVFVLAAHAVETPRLLLYSELARGSGQVGRNLMDHLNRFGWIRAKQPMFPYRGPPTTSGIDVFRDGDFRSHRAAFRLSFGNDGAGRAVRPEQAVLALAQKGAFGQTFLDELRDELLPLFRVSSATEVLPDPQNRVSLSSKKDDFGVPLPSMEFHIDEYSRAGFLYADRVMMTIFERVGFVPPAHIQPDTSSFSGAGHIMGTCRMGLDPATSVVNSEGQVHDHSNLFIAGSSVFPTSGTANPTLTVAALSLRLAAHISGLL